MLRNKDQNRRLHGLLSQLGIDRKTEQGQEVLEEMVYNATNGRTNESSAMLMNECESLIAHLKLLVKQRTANRPPDKANQMRRKMLSHFREMGAPWFDSGYNWAVINDWLEKYGYLHKPMNDYKEAELPKLITQVEQLLKSHYAKRKI